MSTYGIYKNFFFISQNVSLCFEFCLSRSRPRCSLLLSAGRTGIEEEPRDEMDRGRHRRPSAKRPVSMVVVLVVPSAVLVAAAASVTGTTLVLAASLLLFRRLAGWTGVVSSWSGFCSTAALLGLAPVWPQSGGVQPLELRIRFEAVLTLDKAHDPAFHWFLLPGRKLLHAALHPQWTSSAGAESCWGRTRHFSTAPAVCWVGIPCWWTWFLSPLIDPESDQWDQ